eukprot:TRINITY_DN19367_c0_g1_i1.p1 TRINITY_DN19367_c0_g1~~TRINITY_DN19367_c0_g1_i1.p1  ORF type:complete len:286 (-),score=56.17 TRINITY_DN19367_c0_g1_i1:647-1504(-)
MGGHSSKEEKKKQFVPPPPPPAFVPPKMIGESSLLTPESIEMLCKQLMWEHKQTWKLLFDSGKDGKSFTRFGDKSCMRGPTIVVIKDADGHIFGGFADDSWKSMKVRASEHKREAAAATYAAAHHQEYEKKEIKKQDRYFFGTNRSFVFNLHPQNKLYTPSGYNSNFLYYNEQPEIPKLRGFGMGGQVEYFGWFVDGGLDHGHSWARSLCYTFDSPCLAGAEKFDVDTVECWQVDKTVIEEEAEMGEGDKKANLRDNAEFAADKVILEMHGTEFYGDKERGCGGS